MSNLSEATKFLSDPQVKAATATSTFDMADLIRARAVTVYLVIPPDRIDTQRTWLRLMTTAAMHLQAVSAWRASAAPLHDIDGRVSGAPGASRICPPDIATMSGYGIDFTLIIITGPRPA